MGSRKNSRPAKRTRQDRTGPDPAGAVLLGQPQWADEVMKGRSGGGLPGGDPESPFPLFSQQAQHISKNTYFALHDGGRLPKLAMPSAGEKKRSYLCSAFPVAERLTSQRWEQKCPPPTPSWVPWSDGRGLAEQSLVAISREGLANVIHAHLYYRSGL